VKSCQNSAQPYWYPVLTESQPKLAVSSHPMNDGLMEQDLTLREALAENRLADFVRQEEDRGVELTNGSEFERALALLITNRRVAASKASSWLLVSSNAFQAIEELITRMPSQLGFSILYSTV
jgi:hypothetical protein